MATKLIDNEGIHQVCEYIAGQLGKKIETVNVNDIALEMNAVDKSVNVTVPTKISDLTNDEAYQTEEQVTASIEEALGNIIGVKFEVVTELPETGADGTIYLIASEGSEGNLYNEYIWVGAAFEMLGTTEAKFSQYWAKDELEVMTSEEITAVLNAAFTDE